MPVSFASLPAHEKQAFFSLLDEYFESRPDVLSAFDTANASAAEPTIPASTSHTFRQAPAPAARSQPPPPPTARRSGPSAVAGLSTGKSMGRLDMSSKGAAFGSMIMGKPRAEGPVTVGEAVSVGRALAAEASRSLPPASAPRAAATVKEPAHGQAEVLYDYNGGEAEDLMVKRFEVIDLVDRISDDWWRARTTDGRQGIVPSTYVKQI